MMGPVFWFDSFLIGGTGGSGRWVSPSSNISKAAKSSPVIKMLDRDERIDHVNRW